MSASKRPAYRRRARSLPPERGPVPSPESRDEPVASRPRYNPFGLVGPDRLDWDTAPEWLRRRRMPSSADGSADGWTDTRSETELPDRGMGGRDAELRAHPRLSFTAFAIAVTPLVIGLVLLFLGYGSGDLSVTS